MDSICTPLSIPKQYDRDTATTAATGTARILPDQFQQLATKYDAINNDREFPLLTECPLLT